jgi:hypothetical protein
MCGEQHPKAMNSPVTSATGLRAYRRSIVACFAFRREISRKAAWDFFDGVGSRAGESGQLYLRLCCKTVFVSPNTDFPGRGCGKRILMWGTTSFCDELTDDFGGAFEATPIDDCRWFCRLAEILPHSVLGLLQQNPSKRRRQWIC